MTERNYEVYVLKYDLVEISVTISAKSQEEADIRAVEWANDPGNRAEIEEIKYVDDGEWRINPECRCVSCGREVRGNDDYCTHLRHDLFHSIVRGGRGALCRTCTLLRLGRQFTREDFRPGANLEEIGVWIVEKRDGGSLGRSAAITTTDD
jgi:hypothetical protein